MSNGERYEGMGTILLRWWLDFVLYTLDIVLAVVSNSLEQSVLCWLGL